MAKKRERKSGDIFRFLILDGTKNNGRDVYGYGRVIDTTTVAIYSHTSLPYSTSGEGPELETVLCLDVAFVVGCTFDGIDDGTYEVLGNVPLEEKFLKPIRFYHRAVNEDLCKVFNVWEPGIYEDCDIQELPIGLERWAAYSHVHIETRLGICRCG